MSVNLSVSQIKCQSVFQSICQSINQSVNQCLSINQSISMCINQSVHQSICQSISRSVIQSVHQAVCQLISLSLKQSFIPTVGHSINKHFIFITIQSSIILPCHLPIIPSATTQRASPRLCSAPALFQPCNTDLCIVVQQRFLCQAKKP